MSLLTQSKYPGLWKIFQYLIGGTVDKRRLCLQHYHGEKKVLEVGCSIGNISAAFVDVPGISFTGIDIDPVVIEYARQKFRRFPNFEFICQDLCAFSQSENEKYDYILFAGICHHVNDQGCLELLNAAERMLAEKGTMIVVDPLSPDSEDPWFVHTFLKLEQGGFLRTGRTMRELLQKIVGSSQHTLKISNKEERLIGATPFHWPTCARFGVYTMNLV